LVSGVAVEVDGDFDIPGFVTGFITTERAGTDCFGFASYAAAVGGAASLPCPLPGDVDNDGDRDSIDALFILRLVAGFILSLPCES
jgi:hypothetical protein